jgi:hypothetical protein
MLGCRSLYLPLITCDPNIEHTLRQIRAERNSKLPKEHTTDTMAGANHVAFPDVTETHYEIKPSTIQSLPTFLRLTHENPYDFLCEFQTIYSTIQLTGFTENALKMRLFIFTLKDRAKH